MKMGRELLAGGLDVLAGASGGGAGGCRPNGGRGKEAGGR